MNPARKKQPGRQIHAISGAGRIYGKSIDFLQFVAQVPESAPACPPVGSAQQQSVSGGARYLGDVDYNGVVDARDALAVLGYLAGDPATST